MFRTACTLGPESMLHVISLYKVVPGMKMTNAVQSIINDYKLQYLNYC
jgi:hypothetical protein